MWKRQIFKNEDAAMTGSTQKAQICRRGPSIIGTMTDMVLDGTLDAQDIQSHSKPMRGGTF